MISPVGRHVADMKIKSVKLEPVQNFGDFLKAGY